MYLHDIERNGKTPTFTSKRILCVNGRQCERRNNYHIQEQKDDKLENGRK